MFVIKSYERLFRIQVLSSVWTLRQAYKQIILYSYKLVCLFVLIVSYMCQQFGQILK